MRKKVLLIYGTRPEAIKMAPIVKEFTKHEDLFELKICVTGQHREMLDQVNEFFEIKPDIDLNIMRKEQDLYDIFSQVLLGLREVFNLEKPDLVLVHGDTSTSAAAALSAFYQQIPVAHVEAGLRTYNIYSPWPEEINRQITSKIATFHFAPTGHARNNLVKENINPESILITGNTVIDALRFTKNKIERDLRVSEELEQSIEKKGYRFSRSLKEKQMVLITGHRRENMGDGFENICLAIKELALKYSDVDFVYPVHLNPNVRKQVYAVLSDDVLSNIYLIEPTDYLQFVFLIMNSYLILTDSGGIQEEAPEFGKPVLVMRDTTERPEAIEAGTSILVGANKEKIVFYATKLLDDREFYSKISNKTNPFGDGKASERIVQHLMSFNPSKVK